MILLLASIILPVLTILMALDNARAGDWRGAAGAVAATVPAMALVLFVASAVS